MLALVMDDLSLVYYIAKYLERCVLSTNVNITSKTPCDRQLLVHYVENNGMQQCSCDLTKDCTQSGVSSA